MNSPFPIKICTKCKKILVVCSINFCKQKKGKYGFASECKVCRNKRYKKWREDNLGYDIERHSKWRTENKEHIKNYDKERYKNEREHILVKRKEYDKNNPEKVFNRHHRRKVLKENQGDGITKEQWLEMMKFFNFKCAYSGITLSKETRTIDHIVPLAKGGEHEIWNLVPMCKNYNSSKGSKDVIGWYKEQTFFDKERLNKIYQWQEYAFNKWGTCGRYPSKKELKTIIKNGKNVE